MSVDAKTLFGLTDPSAVPAAVRAFRSALILGRRLQHLMDEDLRADDLTTQQAALLTVVAAMGAPTAVQAATALGSTRQNVAQLISALERKQFLVVEPDPADGRRKLLRATSRSADYWAQRDAADADQIAGWFSSLTGPELEEFCRLSGKVIDHVARSGRDRV